MVKCPKCGEILAEDAVRCSKCGALLSNESTSKTKGSYNKIIAVIAIVVIIAIVGVLASGMFSNDNSGNDTQVEKTDTAEPIKEDTSSSSNDSDASASTTEYWASAKAGKFHLPSCEWAQKISEDNKIIYQSREDAIADGKEPCGACNP